MPSKTTSPAHIGSAEMPFKLFNLDEASGILGIGRRTIQEKVAARELGCIRIGRCTRFSAADITAFIEANRVKALGWKGGAR